MLQETNYSEEYIHYVAVTMYTALFSLVMIQSTLIRNLYEMYPRS